MTATIGARMRFGVGIPTGGEGLMYPAPFGELSDIVELGVAAERLGFDSIWVNDHVTTQQYVREHFDAAPRYYDPLVYLAHVAARTTTLHLATCIVVMSFRHPAILAKSAATLDHLSDGRLILGVGIGAYREEIEALYPNDTIVRGEQAEETLQALGSLFTNRTSSFKGEYINYEGVESHPKPLQNPLPILSGGNSGGARRRAALYAHGWLPASQRPEDIKAGIAQIHEIAERDGRELPENFEVAPQMAVSLGRDWSEAWARFERSQLYVHKQSLASSTLKHQQGQVDERNLFGHPDQILERVAAYNEAGVTTLPGLLFTGDSPTEVLEQMQWFSEEVIARVPSGST